MAHRITNTPTEVLLSAANVNLRFTGKYVETLYSTPIASTFIRVSVAATEVLRSLGGQNSISAVGAEVLRSIEAVPVFAINTASGVDVLYSGTTNAVATQAKAEVLYAPVTSALISENAWEVLRTTTGGDVAAIITVAHSEILRSTEEEDNFFGFVSVIG